MTFRFVSCLHIFSIVLPLTVGQPHYQPSCRMPDNIVTLEYNPVLGEYQVAPENSRHLRGHQSQRTLGASDLFDESYHAAKDEVLAMSIPMMNRKIQSQVDEYETIQARLCSCSMFNTEEPHYCPLSRDFCSIPRRSRLNPNPAPLCIPNPKVQNLQKNLVLFTVVAFFLASFGIVLTRPGRHFFGYLCSFVIPKYNEYVATRMIQRSPGRAEAFMRINVRVRRSQLRERMNSRSPWCRCDGFWLWLHELRGDPNEMASELRLETQATLAGIDNQHIPDLQAVQRHRRGEDQRSPISLRLRTRRYQSEVTAKDLEPSNDDDELDTQCIICFSEIDNGEKVGVLACRHVFHASCLKSWLTVGRNSCPLCQADDAAEPIYERNAETG